MIKDGSTSVSHRREFSGCCLECVHKPDSVRGGLSSSSYDKRCVLDFVDVEPMVQERVRRTHVKPTLPRTNDAAFHLLLHTFHLWRMFPVHFLNNLESIGLKAIEENSLNAAWLIEECSGIGARCHARPPCCVTQQRCVR